MRDSDPETQEINKIRPMIAQLAAFRNFPGAVQKRETQEEPSGLSELKRWS